MVGVLGEGDVQAGKRERTVWRSLRRTEFTDLQATSPCTALSAIYLDMRGRNDYVRTRSCFCGTLQS